MSLQLQQNLYENSCIDTSKARYLNYLTHVSGCGAVGVVLAGSGGPIIGMLGFQLKFTAFRTVGAVLPRLERYQSLHST